jgi:hypothetical protein
MDTLPRTEVFGYGVLKMKTGTTLVTLKAQQVQLAHKELPAQLELRVTRATPVLLAHKVSRVILEILVHKVQQDQQAPKVHKAQRVFKVPLV